MNSRDKILARLNNWPAADKTAAAGIGDHEIYRDYPAKSSELLTTFTKQLTLLQGEPYLAESRRQAADYLYQILKDFPGHSSLRQHTPLLAEIISARAELSEYFDDTFKLDSDSISFSGYNCGITTADYLVARTGSIILTSLSAAGRRLSVLPPLHIVIAAERQIVPSLDEAFRRIEEKSIDWSYGVVITGPSRTSDIEKQLVLGAHGPKRLVVIIMRS